MVTSDHAENIVKLSKCAFYKSVPYQERVGGIATLIEGLSKIGQGNQTTALISSLTPS